MTKIKTRLGCAQLRENIFHDQVKPQVSRETEEGVHGVSGHAEGLPLGEELGLALLGVEGDGGGVPVEGVPVEPRVAAGVGDGGDGLEEEAAEAVFAVGLDDEEVFEVGAGPGPRRVGVVEEREADGVVVVFCEKAVEFRRRRKAVAQQVGLGDLDGGFGFLFVGRQADDEAPERRGVAGLGEADPDHGAPLGRVEAQTIHVLREGHLDALAAETRLVLRAAAAAAA
eukprot:CAMPEP_0198672950 /NCGR_PEP_ID=MMETSP1467-20131203/93830_1 /TAXON_ID=1462469 /ORGANISM="unid. sp., Strain CCMP2135" /LENGTH=226 /DNA_ID=CAMNT_0044409795 /DNA_START=22 /DNA_END=700 /DNA_ORIENTATION=-